MRNLWIVITILTLLIGCHQKKEEPIQDRIWNEAELDSIFSNFEITADENAAIYLHNPDSLLSSLNAIPQTNLQKEMFANGLVLMAYSLGQNGNVYESIKYYEKTLKFVEDHRLQEIDKIRSVIRPLANLYVRIDDNAKAITVLENAILETEDQTLKNSLLIALANANLYYGKFDVAKKILLPIAESTIDPLVKARSFNILSEIYRDLADSLQHQTYNKLSIKEFEKEELEGEAVLWYASALSVAAALDNDNAAISLAVTLVNQHYPNSQMRTKAKLLATQGDLSLNLKNWNRAKENYTSALTFLQQGDQKYILDYTYTRALFGLAHCYEKSNNTDSALYYYQWAIENDFRTQQLITGKADQLKNNKWHRNMLKQMIDLAEKRLTMPNVDSEKIVKQLLWCVELSKARLLINEINRSELWESSSIETKQAIQHIRELYTHLDQTTKATNKKRIQSEIDQLLVSFQLSEKYFETFNLNPVQENFLAKLQHPNADYYSYFIHEDTNVSVFSVVDGQYKMMTIKNDDFMSNIRQFKKDYFGDNPEKYKNSPKRYQKSAQDIINQILPVRPNENRKIYVSLDGDLYGLPFDALWEEDFLVKKYSFAYLNSFLLFDFLSSEKTSGKEITILYRSAYPDPLPDLNFVPKEVERISKSFKTKEIAPDEQFDTTISQVFDQANIVHIAAHTVINEKDQAPLIYLEQLISTNQIRFYQMNTPLVFLSACNTGSGLSLPSEGMESIQRVFLGKGVSSVISTYWFANDEVMLTLTEDFYKQLQQVAHPATALAMAKRNYLAHADSEQQNPWYWANINYTGVDNEIGLKSSSSRPLLILLFLIGGTLIIYLKKQYSKRKRVSKSTH